VEARVRRRRVEVVEEPAAVDEEPPVVPAVCPNGHTLPLVGGACGACVDAYRRYVAGPAAGLARLEPERAERLKAAPRRGCARGNCGAAA
jgi:hypothetical protein